MNNYVCYHFIMKLIFQEKKGHLEGMPKPIKWKLLTKIEVLSDSLLCVKIA